MHNTVAAHKCIERTLWCLANIAEQVAEAIAVFNLNGTILFVNTAWAAIHEYNAKHQLTGKHISLFHTQQQMKTDVVAIHRGGQTQRPARRATPTHPKGWFTSKHRNENDYRHR